MRRCSACGRPYAPRSARQRFCATACRERVLGRSARARQATTTERGYGRTHKALREAYALRVARGEVMCWRCGDVIAPGTAWHLGHDDDRTRYRGPEHERCNTAAGARTRNRLRTELPTAVTTDTMPRGSDRGSAMGELRQCTVTITVCDTDSLPGYGTNSDDVLDMVRAIVGNALDMWYADAGHTYLRTPPDVQ